MGLSGQSLSRSRKQFGLAFISLCLSFIVSAQETNVFNQAYDLGDLFFGLDVLENGDDGYVVLSYPASILAFDFVVPQVTFSFVDKDGCIYETQEYNIGELGGGVVLPRYFSRTSDSGWVVCGWLYVAQAANYDAFVLKIGSDHEYEWHQRVGGDKADNLYAVLESSTGDFMAVGRTKSFSQDGGSDAYVVSISSQGELLQEINISSGSGNENVFSDLVQETDSTFVIHSINGCCFLGLEEHNELVRLNSDFEVVERAAYLEKPPGFFGLGTGNLFKTSDGGFITAAMVLYNPDKYHAVITKLDGVFNTVWSDELAIGPEFGWDTGSEVIELADGSYLLVGYFDSGNVENINRQKGFAAKYSSEGEQLWQKEYVLNDATFACESHRAAPTADGGAVISGFVRSEPYPGTNSQRVSPWLFKIDSDGNVNAPLLFEDEFVDLQIVTGETIDLTSLPYEIRNVNGCVDLTWSCVGCTTEQQAQLEEGVFISDTVGAFEIFLMAEDSDETVQSSSFTITTSFPIGLDNGDPNGIVIHPNPARGISFVRLDGIESFESVSIYDFSGRLVKVGDDMLVEVGDLVPGRYILQVRSKSGIDNLSFLKL